MSETSTQSVQESLERLSRVLSPEDIQALQAIQNEPLPTGIRINPLKTNSEQVIFKLSERYGWQVKPLEFCKNAWVITKAKTPPGTTIEHRLGQYYLQDAASMVPVSLYDLENPRTLILDMAASPGGKTTHLIARVGDKGFVIANDASRNRIPALRSVLSSWGGINQIVTNFPGEAFGGWYPEVFDLVLLDAPCSMENLRPTPERTPRETTVDERLRLQARQIELLKSGFMALKIGGQIVYATCSLAPEEDEAVIDALLKSFPGKAKIREISNRFPFKASGLTHFKDKAFHPALVHALRLWPHLTGMSGFFCALIEKIGGIPQKSKDHPHRDFSKTGLSPVQFSLQSQIMSSIQENYGCELQEVLDIYQLNLFKRNHQIFLIPERYLQYFSKLPFEYIGMPLGNWSDNLLQPSHEFISRFGNSFTKGFLILEDQDVALWVAGRDIRHPDVTTQPQGQYVLVKDCTGRNLGMGKLLPKRLRNMLPRHLI